MQEEILLLLLNVKSKQQELKALVRRNGPASPLYGGMDECFFLQILTLRKLMKWAEARHLANQLISLFPRSPYVDHMGGTEGRTEDQAAVAYAQALKPYFDRRFDESRKLLQEFFQNYPNNWRRDAAELHRNRCLYYGGKEDEFMDISTEIVNNDLDFPYTDELLYLQTAVLIHRGDGEGARRLLDYLEEYYPHSRWRNEFSQLRLESWFTKNLASVTTGVMHVVVPLYQKQLAHSREINRWYAKNLSFGIKLYNKLGLSDELEEVFRDEMAMLDQDDKKYLWLCLGYAEYLENTNQIDEAMNFLTSVLNQVNEPCYERARVLESLSMLYLNKESTDKTGTDEPIDESALTQLLEEEMIKSRDDPNNYFGVGCVYVRYLINKGEPEEAIKTANSILQEERAPCEERTELLRIVARIYAGKGELEKARSIMNQSGEKSTTIR